MTPSTSVRLWVWVALIKIIWLNLLKCFFAKETDYIHKWRIDNFFFKPDVQTLSLCYVKITIHNMYTQTVFTRTTATMTNVAFVHYHPHQFQRVHSRPPATRTEYTITKSLSFVDVMLQPCLSMNKDEGRKRGWWFILQIVI